MPLVIRTTEEALIAVPDMYHREASFGLGAGKLRTIFRIILPAAVPGILSGVILSIGRIVGETGVLIYTSGTVAQTATDLTKSGRTLAVHMYSLSREGLHMDEAYATALVLLILVVLINAISDGIAKKVSKSVRKIKGVNKTYGEQSKISIQDLNLYYGDFHALKGINMELPEKEISAFIGPSGCGKSTLLKASTV